MAPHGGQSESETTSRIAQPRSLVEFAAEALRAKVMLGELKPGERVIENQITKELGISRPPLREAFRALEQEGLLTQQARKGTIVTPITLHDVYEIFTLRLEYESIAVRRALPVSPASPKIARVRSALGQMRQAAGVGDIVKYDECSFEFHLAIVGLAGIQRLEASYKLLQMQMHLCRSVINRPPDIARDPTSNLETHARLLELIESGDKSAVLCELERHGDRSYLREIENYTTGHSEEALAWIDQFRAVQGE